MHLEQSERGFWFLMNPARLPPHQDERLVSESSAIGDDSLDRPGSSYLWIDKHHHLDRKQVAELVTHLQRWLDTGTLED